MPQFYSTAQEQSKKIENILRISLNKGKGPKKNIQNVNFFQIGLDPPTLSPLKM